MDIKRDQWDSLCDLVLNLVQVNRALVQLIRKDEDAIISGLATNDVAAIRDRLRSIDTLCEKLDHRGRQLENGIINMRDC